MSETFDPQALWEKLVAPYGLLARRPEFGIDPDFYAGRYPQVAASGLPPREHYDTIGKAEGLAPNQYAELRASMPGLDRRLLHILHDVEMRKAIRANVEGAGEVAFELLALGEGLDRQLSDFSAKHYVRLYPDIGAAKLLPIGHFLRHGEREGRRSLRDLRENYMLGEAQYDPDKPSCLICVHEFSRSGAPIVGLDLVRTASKTHNVIVGSLRGGELLESFRANAVAVLLSDKPELEFDLVVDNSVGEIEFAIINSVVANNYLPLCVSRGIPVGMYLHEYAEYILPRHFVTFSGLMSDLLVFSSAQVLNSWRPALEDIGFDIERDTVIIPQADYQCSTIPTDDYDRARDRLSRLIRRDLTGKRVVLGAGHAHWRKGTDMFVLTAQQARDIDPDTVYVWIGNGLNPENFHFGVWQDQHNREGGANDPAGNLFFLPAGDYFEDVCRASDVLFLSSRLDPLPNVVFDAARLGCQVLGFSNASGFDDPTYLDEPGLHMVPFGRLDKVVDKLSSLPRKPEFQASLPPRGAGDERSIFERLHSALEESIGSQRHAVIGSGSYDMPIMFTTAPDDAAGRRAERQKVWSHGRRFVWRSAGEAQAEIVRSDNWLHKSLEVRPYADAAAPKERDALPEYGIHLHGYNLDGLDQDIETHAAYRLASRIVATTDSTKKQDQLNAIFANHGLEGSVQVVRNQGRDILPFMRLFDEGGAGHDQENWLHIHQKKAPTWGQAGGEIWRKFLMAILMGEYGRLSDGLSSIATPGTGLVAPFDPYRFGWGASKQLLPEFADQFPGDLPDVPIAFPVGNMFWVRREVAQAMNAMFGPDYPWPNEPLPNDGTVFHLIERLWPAVTAKCGLRSVFLDKPDQQRR